MTTHGKKKPVWISQEAHSALAQLAGKHNGESLGAALDRVLNDKLRVKTVHIEVPVEVEVEQFEEFTEAETRLLREVVKGLFYQKDLRILVARTEFRQLLVKLSKVVEKQQAA